MTEPQMPRREIFAIKVHQWLDAWDGYEYNQGEHRAQPEPYFYLFSMPASYLRALSGTYPRTVEGGLKRHMDMGFQRRHDPSRSSEIAEFLQFGYPWSKLNQVKRKSGLYDDLRKPGWLPTAIVVNILTPDQKKRGLAVAAEDIIEVNTNGLTNALIRLPHDFSGTNWRPKQSPPIEIIDGQHRLGAFTEELAHADFELPVVAFNGLDISWQAYLFWTINITPKRINASLAFDLYPLLRAEDWLERFEGPAVYRETRAQELVESLWSHPESPWHQRINMLGEPRQPDAPSPGNVTQAAWIRSLLASYIKAWEGKGIRGIGGLFGARLGVDNTVLPWSRAQQAAFLMYSWQKVKWAVKESQAPWAVTLRQEQAQLPLWLEESDPAFEGDNTLLNTDQGVRGVLYVMNDLCYIEYANKKLDLEHWSLDQDAGASDEDAVTEALERLSQERSISDFLTAIASGLAKFDWRTANSAEGDEKTAKMAFRGSGGYKLLRRQLLDLLVQEPGKVGDAAARVLYALGYREV